MMKRIVLVIAIFIQLIVAMVDHSAVNSVAELTAFLLVMVLCLDKHAPEGRH